jgi:hypothetical protein
MTRIEEKLGIKLKISRPRFVSVWFESKMFVFMVKTVVNNIILDFALIPKI